MIEWNIRNLLKILSRCSDIALSHYEEPEVSVKDDKSLVTGADFEIENHLASYFDKPDDGSYMIGEESVHKKSQSYLQDAFSHIAWIIDPIDGTAPYAHHIPTWGVSIARMVNGRLADGAIYLPPTGELFATERDLVLYGRKAMANAQLAEIKLLPLARPHHDPDDPESMARGMIALAQDVARGYGIQVPNPVQALGCAVMPLTYLLLGRYMAYIGTVKLWDMAAALPMLLRMGFPVQLADGTPVDEKVSEGIYRLGADDSRQWRLRERLVCGASKGTIDYMMAALAEAGAR